jgi:hypothetical protein
MMDKYVAVNNNEFAHRCMDGEAVVISLKDSHFYSLNETAAFIWRQADGRTTIREVIQNLHREFEVDFKTAEKDGLAIIKKLAEKGMLTLSADPT